jgi:hypothetical protein
LNEERLLSSLKYLNDCTDRLNAIPECANRIEKLVRDEIVQTIGRRFRLERIGLTMLGYKLGPYLGAAPLALYRVFAVNVESVRTPAPIPERPFTRPLG